MFFREQLFIHFEQSVCNHLGIVTEHQPRFCSENKDQLIRVFDKGLSASEASDLFRPVNPMFKKYSRHSHAII